MAIERRHLTSKSLTRIRAARKQEAGPKPNGLWYEVGHGWQEFVESNGFHPKAYRIAYSVDVSKANMLYIKTVRQMDAFAKKWGIPDPFGVGRLLDSYRIDWPAFTKLYDGIEIAPYQWQRRHKYMFYYGWDCASGVIWRPKNVAFRFGGEVKYDTSIR